MMNTATQVTNELRRRGELWEPLPGVVALRGDALRLLQRIDEELRALSALERADEWAVPPALPFATLARADYFASFPQWLTAAAHLSTDPRVLEAVADSPDPACSAAAALEPQPVALQPAVCYHVYAAHAGTTLTGVRICSVCGTCWRNEADGFTALERGWAFTMREIVCLGAPVDVTEFRARGFAAVTDLAYRLGLHARLEQASDPFFAASTRGRALLQRVKALKHEVMLPIGDGRFTAAASLNDHAGFFGAAFDIRLPDGMGASSGCIAFGVERWLLAVLVEHGSDPRNWPLQTTFSVAEMRSAW
jgi:seryl-tRNA synthetase